MNSELFARTQEIAAEWRETHKGHPRLIELADRHYTRQRPGTSQCTRPGVNLVLLLSDGSAAWVVWRPIPEVGRADNLEAWECTLFRNEGARRSSDLIREATDITYRKWGWPPKDGLITAVGIPQTAKRRSKRSVPGACFWHAGWQLMTRGNPKPDQAWLTAPRPKRIPKEIIF